MRWQMLTDGKYLIAALLALGIGWAANTADAAEIATDWVVTDQSRVRVISSLDGVKDQKYLHLGLQMQLQPGWKTYWRSPGDAGIPPQLNWEGSLNLAAAEISWPRPEKFEAFGFETWGYHDEVVYPIRITLEDASRPVELTMNLSYGICGTVCIPYQHEFTLNLSDASANRVVGSDLIEDFLSRVPDNGNGGKNMLALVQARRVSGTEFEINARSERGFSQPGLIVEETRGTFFRVQSPVLSVDGKNARFNVMAEFAQSADDISDVPLTLTLYDGDAAIERTIVVPSQ